MRLSDQVSTPRALCANIDLDDELLAEAAKDRRHEDQEVDSCVSSSGVRPLRDLPAGD
jgi:hypothetical protein